MKSPIVSLLATIAAVVLSLLAATPCFAGDMELIAGMAVDQNTEPATSFASDTPKLFAFFQTKGGKKGDELRSVWTAVDVGDAAPANTKIAETTVTGDKDDFFGNFSFSKPDNGWPVGDYKVEIYNGENLVTTLEFAITEAGAE